MTNINDTYFDGFYKELWRSIIPSVLTEKEIEFIVPYFNLQPGSKVLDLMCGYGRHAIALAKKGATVTAIDNLAEYIDEINKTAAADKLSIKTMRANVVEYKAEDVFDLAICMGNSLNFFDAGDCSKILMNIADHLKPGGHLLIHSWSIAEIIYKNFTEKTWTTIDGFKLLTDAKIFFQPARMEAETTIIAPDGSTEVKKAIDYIFSINEMESLLEHAGLLVKEIFSIPGRKKFTVGEPRVYIIAEKQ